MCESARVRAGAWVCVEARRARCVRGVRCWRGWVGGPAQAHAGRGQSGPRPTRACAAAPTCRRLHPGAVTDRVVQLELEPGGVRPSRVVGEPRRRCGVERIVDVRVEQPVDALIRVVIVIRPSLRAPQARCCCWQPSTCCRLRAEDSIGWRGPTHLVQIQHLGAVRRHRRRRDECRVGVAHLAVAVWRGA